MEQERSGFLCIPIHLGQCLASPATEVPGSVGEEKPVLGMLKNYFWMSFEDLGDHVKYQHAHCILSLLKCVCVYIHRKFEARNCSISFFPVLVGKKYSIYI